MCVIVVGVQHSWQSWRAQRAQIKGQEHRKAFLPYMRWASLRGIKRHFTTHNSRDIPPKKVVGWRKYAYQFQNKPFSFLASFAVLHEITAIAPIPIIYLLLDRLDVEIPFISDIVTAEGNRVISKIREKYGYPALDQHSRVAINLATAYAIVKVAMPLRIGLCIGLTPWFATRITQPLLNVLKWKTP